MNQKKRELAPAAEEKREPAPPEHVTFQLKHAITWLDEKIDHLTLKRPKVKHLMELDLTELTAVKNIIHVAHRVSGKPTKFFEEMDIQDLLKLTEVINGFLGVGQETGTTD